MIDYNNPNDPWMQTGYDPYKGMSDEEREKAGCFQLLAFVAMLAVVFFLLVMFTGCTTTRYVTVVAHQTDTLRQAVVERDSIHVHDSIHVSEKGDTVRIDRWHTRYVEREVHDTTFIARHDTIPQPYEVVKEVPRQRTGMEWALLAVGLLSLIAVIVWTVGKLKRFLPMR